ncbi:MAG TPA: hypothetical protein VK508_01870 [Cyclobacteriaceae bacterium]|nr:hypothetical protein [Cyclobacteriaceae bacterium]
MKRKKTKDLQLASPVADNIIMAEAQGYFYKSQKYYSRVYKKGKRRLSKDDLQYYQGFLQSTEYQYYEQKLAAEHVTELGRVIIHEMLYILGYSDHRAVSEESPIFKECLQLFNKKEKEKVPLEDIQKLTTLFGSPYNIGNRDFLFWLFADFKMFLRLFCDGALLTIVKPNHKDALEVTKLISSLDRITEVTITTRHSSTHHFKGAIFLNFIKEAIDLYVSRGLPIKKIDGRPGFNEWFIKLYCLPLAEYLRSQENLNMSKEETSDFVHAFFSLATPLGLSEKTLLNTISPFLIRKPKTTP